MEIRIAADPEWLRNGAHGQMERTLRLTLPSSGSGIRRVAVCLESLFWTKAQRGWECRVYAWLQRSGVTSARGGGDCAEAALRKAAERLVRTLEREDPAMTDEPAGGWTG